MARVLNNPFGELRGKTAAGVFTRTKAGEILRKYVKPVDTQTLKQQNNRSIFGSLSQSFCNLSAAEKADWNAFAQDGAKFNAKHSTNRGQYTGLNAYSSLAMAASRASNLGKDVLAFFLDLESAVIETPSEDYVVTLTPPRHVMTPHIRATTPGPSGSYDFIAITGIKNCVYKPLLGVIDIALEYTATAPVTFESIENEWGEKWGIQIMLSEPLKDQSNRPKNPEMFCLGQSNLITLTTPLTSATKGGMSFQIRKTTTLQGKYDLDPNKIYKATAYAVSKNGAFAKIGETFLEFF